MFRKWRALGLIALGACQDATSRVAPALHGRATSSDLTGACTNCIVGPVTISASPNGAVFERAFSGTEGAVFAVSYEILGGRASSYRIAVNGSTVGTPDDLRGGSTTSTTLIRVKGSNRVFVRLTGGEQTSMTLSIQAVALSGEWGLDTIDVDPVTFGGMAVGSGSESPRQVVGGRVERFVSRQGPQLLFVVDPNGEVRGLGLSRIVNGVADVPRLDALSTVASLVYMAPGIAESDPVLGAQTMSSILSQPCVAQLATAAAAQLPSKTIRQLQADAAFAGSLASCVLQTAAVTTAQALAPPPYDASNDKLTVRVDTGQGVRQVTFSNAAARFVEVYARPSTGPGATQPPQFVTLMESETPVSWGSLFSGSLGQPSTATDPQFAGTNARQVEYWFRGPGFAQTGTVPPQGTFPGSAWMGTVTYNVFMPTVDLIAGAACFGSAPQALKQVSRVLSLAKAAGLDGTTFFSSVVGGGGLVSSTVNFSVALTGQVLGPHGLGLPCIAGNLIKNNLFWWLRIPSAIFAGANLTMFIIDISSVPSTTLFNTPTLATGSVIGKVTRSSGGTLSGVVVSLVGHSPMATTDGAGNYALTDVPVGLYQAALSGLPQGCVSPSSTVDIIVGTTASLDIVVPCAVPNAGVLRAHYPFDGDTQDATGNGHHAISNSALPTAGVNGAASGAYHFDGAVSQMRLPAAPTNNLAQGTISLWLKLDDVGTQYNIFSKSTGTFIYPMRAQFGGGPPVDQWCFIVNNPPPQDCSSPVNSWTPADANRGYTSWHLYTFTWSPADRRIYFDGVLVRTIPGAWTSPSSGDFILSPQSSARNELLKGSIDDLRVYDGALTASEVAALYASPPGPPTPVPTGSWMGRHTNNDPQQGGKAAYYASIEFSRGTNQVSSAACASGGTITSRSATQLTVSFPSCMTEVITYSIQNGVFSGSGVATAISDGRVFATTWSLGQPANSLVAYFPLDFDGSDRSGNGYDGQVQNVTFTSGGPFGEVYGLFGGTSSRVSISDAQRLRLTNTSYTLTGWVNLTQYGGSSDRPLLFKADMNTGGGCFNCVAGGYQWWYGWGNDLIMSTPGKTGSIIPNPLSRWVHLAVVFDKTAGTLTTYADGVAQAQHFSEYPGGPVPALVASASPLYLGYSANYGGSWFKGGLDDVRLYDKALSLTEINQLRTP